MTRVTGLVGSLTHRYLGPILLVRVGPIVTRTVTTRLMLLAEGSNAAERVATPPVGGHHPLPVAPTAQHELVEHRPSRDEVFGLTELGWVRSGE